MPLWIFESVQFFLHRLYVSRSKVHSNYSPFFLQINRNDDWDDLLTSFGIEEATANGSLALKHTYLRYLDPYEKVHFHREEEETNDDWADAEDSRLSRHKKAKVESTVPSNYNYR